MGRRRGEVLKLTLEVGIHLQKLEPQHLRVDPDRMIASTGSLRFVNELVRLDSLLGDGPDGVLEDLAFSPSHVRKLERLTDMLEACLTSCDGSPKSLNLISAPEAGLEALSHLAPAVPRTVGD
jgi:hypothetical protein